VLRCQACSHENPVNSRSCPACGGTVPALDDGATGHFEPKAQLFSDLPSDKPGFLKPRYSSGQILAERFRIVAALGKGGMGEVYRADDLRVGQPVALKFLPESSIADADQLARFQKEIRLARQVSHPNICRVYDVAEHDGQPFLIMEYIDGEDLAKLLPRVGRLSEEKASQIARELCTALGAVHDQGLLHRDLKPANVMLDGRGRVRLTDFGLATPEVDLSTTNVRSGTPQYMAPEQLAGDSVSVHSDLFGLGLVLYELFTGKAAFHGLDRSKGLEKPTSHFKTLNPLTEGAILHCLQPNPEDRPRSAYEVLAELPGGDPLAAALAQGKTPSPEAVANAPIEGTLRPLTAAVVVIALILGIFGVAWLNGRAKLFKRAPLADAIPETLALRAKQIAKNFGYGDTPEGQAQGYAEDRDQKLMPGKESPDGLIPSPSMYFWYRQSPLPLTNSSTVFFPGFIALPGWVKPIEPPMTVAGMTTAVLDLKGNLLEFRAIPAQKANENEETAPIADWPSLFREAGLEMASFHATSDPRHTPPMYADIRQAWDGLDSAGSPLRVEAAAFRGRPVYFFCGLIDRPDRLASTQPQQPPLLGILVPSLIILAFSAGFLLAWRNIRQGRANTQGAWRLALFAFVLHILAWALLATHVRVFSEELGILCGIVGLAFLDSGLLALWYLVLEPYVRRRWPWIMVGWNRMLAGRFGDPMVGRELLIGGLAGTILVLLVQAQALMSTWLGQQPAGSMGIREDLLGHGPAVVVNAFLDALYAAMGKFFAMAFFIVILRSVVWGFAASFCLSTFMMWAGALSAGLPAQPNGPLVVTIGFALVSTAILFVALLRFGLLAYVSATAFYGLLVCAPFTTDLSAWYWVSNLTVWLIVVGTAFYGCIVALGGRRQLLKTLLGDS
jgi:predicted Ser/Thr protein kinase